MNEGRRIIFTAVALCTLIVLPFLAWVPEPASGQQNFPDTTRKTACGCYCGGRTPDYFIFKKDDCAGILAADACGTEMGNMPAAQLAGLCEASRANRSPGSCPALDQLCSGAKNDPKPGCENPKTPWYDRSEPCPDVQSPQIAMVGSEVRLSLCGTPVWRWDPADKDPLLREAYKLTLVDWVEQKMGSKICCTSFKKSMQTGQPCNPAQDIDCDGKPNQSDIDSTYVPGVSFPAIDLYTTGPAADIDPFPYGMNPDDPDFMPQKTARDSKGVGECPCKWQLTSGKLTCSPDGKRDHVYTATWRCPTSGKEVFTTKYAKASARCKEYQRTGMLEYFLPRPAAFLDLVPAARSSCG